MAKSEVRLIAGKSEYALNHGSYDPIVVPAGPVVLSVRGNRGHAVLIDGRVTYLGSSGLTSLDLTDSTGYHRVSVDGSVFWFGTQDAKLGLDGVEAMLTHLRGIGTGWTGQALFSDGAGLRDSHVLYAWLDQWVDRVLSAVETIVMSPRPETTTGRALSRRGGRAVLLSPTLRLLRANPSRYLEPAAGGVLRHGSGRYDPLRVVVRRRSTTLLTVANRRAIEVLDWVLRLCDEVLADSPDYKTVARCRLWHLRALSLQRRPLTRSLRGPSVLGAPRQAEELTEAPYRVTYDVACNLRGAFGWSASIRPLPRFSYVARANAIYQVYAASCLAEVLGLSQTTDVFGAAAPALRGPEFDLYVDSVCPPEVVRSWRAESSQPDASRPDLLLHERATGRVAVLDAKYRLGKDGGASEDSRKDVSAYQALFGLSAITIIYPGEGSDANIISGHGNRIIEVPLRPPTSHLVDMREVILASLQAPRF